MDIYIVGYWSAVVVGLVASIAGFRKKQWLTGWIGIVLLAGCAFLGLAYYSLLRFCCPGA